MSTSCASPTRRRILLAAGAGALVAPFGAGAQGLSSRPVRMILGQTAATTPDLIARTLAPRLQAKWNQPFVVENRGGAGGAIGLEAVAKAPPDGHTITVNVNSTLTLPHFFKIDYDIIANFSPLAILAENPFALVVHPSVPVNTFKEFLEWGKRAGAKANYGSPGNGTHHHLMMESLKLRTGLALTHIPYKGSAPALADLVGGQISCMFLPSVTAMSLGRGGKVRLLGNSMKDRTPLMPDVIPLAEQGLPGFNFYGWFYAEGPAGLPADVVRKYSALFHDVLEDPEVKETFAKNGVTGRFGTPAELDRAKREDLQVLMKLIKDANIKGD